MFSMHYDPVADLARHFTKWHKVWNDARLQIAIKALKFR